jgi:hypothetical protein
MINIKPIEKITFSLKRIFLFLALMSVLFLAPYHFLLWIGSDFNSDFMKIDSCLDSGGAWDELNRQCAYAK